MKTSELAVVVLASRLSSLYAALALVMTAGLASVRADTIMVYEMLSVAGSSGSGWLPQFNPTNGQLTMVVLQFNGSFSESGPVYNPTPTGTSFTIMLTGGGADMNVSSSSLHAHGSFTGGGGGGFLGPYQSTYTGVSAMTYGTAETSQAADLDFFTGTNSVYVTYGITPPTMTPNPSYLQGLEGWTAGGNNASVELVYYYTTPSPGGLSISSSGTGFSITWPAAATNLVLEVTTNLAPPVFWATVTNTPQTNGAMCSVQVDGSLSCQFFRLMANTFTADGMALIPAGSFTMGDIADTNLYGNAAPISVTVSAFYMDMNLVQLSQWQTVYNWATSNGYGFDSAGSGAAPNHPVVNVNWYDMVKWCNARSQQAELKPVYYTDAGLTQVYTNDDTDAVYPDWSAKGYRLPTDAEWEKAARGGLSGKRFPWGDTISENQANYYAAPGSWSYDVNSYSGYNTNYNTGSAPYTSPIGSFAPNGYGLYDMAGNVFEWCWDWYGTTLGQPTTTNPTGPASGDYRVLRGGRWNDSADVARCGYRTAGYPDNNDDDSFGFRCVRGQ